MGETAIEQSQFFSLQTRNTALFEQSMGERLRPVKIDNGLGGSSELEVVQVPLERTTVTTMALTHPVHFHLHGKTKARPGHWLLQFMLTGSSANTFSMKQRPVHLKDDLGLLLPNDYPLDIYGPAKAKYFIFEIRPEDLFQTAARMGVDFCAPEPTQAFPLGGGSGAGLRRYGEMLATEMALRSSFLLTDLVRDACEQYLLSVLVSAISASQEVSAGPALPSRAQPYYVKRAVDYIHATLPSPVGILDLVDVVGVSQRTLFRGFRAVYGQSPMEFIRCQRLDRAHEALAASDPTLSSVTEVAIKWGFTHLSNFAHVYGKRFGERPSETLARSR